MGLFRFRYGKMNLDQFMELQSRMYRIGFDISAYPGDYGKATCLNCRSTVRIGAPEFTGLAYAKQHRVLCGDRFLSNIIRERIGDQLSAIPNDWWSS